MLINLDAILLLAQTKKVDGIFHRKIGGNLSSLIAADSERRHCTTSGPLELRISCKMFLTGRILKKHQRLIFAKSLHLENVFPPAAPFIIKVDIYSVI